MKVKCKRKGQRRKTWVLAAVHFATSTLKPIANVDRRRIAEQESWTQRPTAMRFHLQHSFTKAHCKESQCQHENTAEIRFAEIDS